jgi:hypothetical protein
MSSRRASLTVTVLAVTALTTAACSFTGSIRDADAASRSAAGATSAATSPAPTGAGATDRCHTAALTGAVSSPDAGAGQRYSTLTLTNTGGAACTVHGYGGLGLVDASGQALPTAQVRVPAPAPMTVTLPPGGHATALLHWSAIPGSGDAAGGACQPTAAILRVIPPDETDALSVPWAGGPVCEQGRIEQQAYAA